MPQTILGIVQSPRPDARHTRPELTTTRTHEVRAMAHTTLTSIVIAAVACLFAAGAHAGSCDTYPGGAKVGQAIPGSCGVVVRARSGGAGGNCNAFQMAEDGQWFVIYGLDPTKDMKQQFVTAS